MLRRRLDGLAVTISSFGTLAVDGQPALPDAAAVALALGIDLKRHRSRRLQPGCLRDIDLIVGFEPAHIATAVEAGGAELARTFMMLELPALLYNIPRAPETEATGDVDEARRVIAGMDESRASVATQPASLADPFGASRQVFAETARVIDATTALLADTLFP